MTTGRAATERTNATGAEGMEAEEHQALQANADQMKASGVSISHAGVKNALPAAADRLEVPS
jgi:hypothetical protein